MVLGAIYYYEPIPTIMLVKRLSSNLINWVTIYSKLYSWTMYVL